MKTVKAVDERVAQIQGPTAKLFAQEIFAVMDTAEGMGGPEDQEYVELMEAVARDANQRIANYRAWNTHGIFDKVMAILEDYRIDAAFCTNPDHIETFADSDEEPLDIVWDAASGKWQGTVTTQGPGANPVRVITSDIPADSEDAEAIALLIAMHSMSPEVGPKYAVITGLLAQRGIVAYVEHPGYIAIAIPNGGFVNWGVANGVWDGDVTDADQEVIGAIHSGIPQDSRDWTAIADFIAKHV